MLEAIGVLLIHVAAYYAALGTVAETCTMGAADSLAIGPVISIPLYAIGFGLLVLRPLRLGVWLATVPALVAIVYQVYWTLRSAIAGGIYSVAACDVVDGREPQFVVTWIGMSIVAVTGVMWALTRTYQLHRLSNPP